MGTMNIPGALRICKKVRGASQKTAFAYVLHAHIIKIKVSMPCQRGFAGLTWSRNCHNGHISNSFCT